MWRRFLTAIPFVSMLAGSSAQAQHLLTLDQFRERFLAALHAHDPSITWTVDAPDQITVKGPHATGPTYLGNAYTRYRHFPDELDDILRRFVSLATSSDADYPVAADQLMVLARPVGFGAEAGAAVEARPLGRPFGGDLEAYVAVNRPETITYPTLERLHQALGDDDKTIWAKALANTPKVRGSLAVEAVTPKIFMVSCGSGMAATLLFDDTAWVSPQLASLGAHPAVTVEKDKLLAVNGDDPEALAMLRRMLRASEDLAISSYIYVRRDGVWTVLP